MDSRVEEGGREPIGDDVVDIGWCFFETCTKTFSAQKCTGCL
jgi:hypothetical protein